MAPRPIRAWSLLWTLLVLLQVVVGENEAILAVPLSVDCLEESFVAVT